MNRYAEYRESGVEWIGEIPSHWDAKRLASFGSFYKGKSITKGDLRVTGQPCILYSQIYTSYDRITVEVGSYIEQRLFDQSIKVTNEIFLFTCSGETADEIGKCLLYYGDEEISIGGDIVAFKLQPDAQFDPVFLSFVFNCSYSQFFKASNSRGEIVVHIYKSQLRELRVVFPSIEEQIEISQYLNEKTSQIDSLSEKLQRKIELLIEQRTALINLCVTKGLNPNVKMKDSGVEWIGEIPSHWEISLLKHFCSHINFKRHAKNNEIKISPENVEPGTGKILDYQSNYENIGMEFEFGDTLLNKLRVYLAKVVFCEFSGLSMGEMIVLRPTRIDPNKFQFYLLSSCRFIDHLNSLSEGVKMPRTPINGIMKSRVPITTLREQSQISQFLNKKTSQFDSLIEKLQRKIEILKEYRHSLISNVVTGKVKVTEEAI